VLAGESVAMLGYWRRHVGVGALSAACQRGFCRLALGWVRWQGGVNGASAVVHWWGRGDVMALVPVHWCRRGREPTINKRWKVKGKSGETITA
jgi:hypothetical protein